MDRNPQNSIVEGLCAPSLSATPETLKTALVDSAGALPCIVASWPRNIRETVCVKLDQYRGRNTIDVRTWYPGDDGELKPGKGLTLSVSHLPKLAAALADALAKAKALGLIQEGGGE